MVSALKPPHAGEGKTTTTTSVTPPKPSGSATGRKTRASIELSSKLPGLAPQKREECRLSEQERFEAGRVAYEAKVLLDFLREFRAHTERPITVFGNNATAVCLSSSPSSLTYRTIFAYTTSACLPMARRA